MYEKNKKEYTTPKIKGLIEFGYFNLENVYNLKIWNEYNFYPEIIFTTVNLKPTVQ